MRQQGEHQFCKALNNIAEGIMDSDDIALIKSREISENNQPPANATWLFSTNQECQVYNEKIHNQLGTEYAISVAHDKVEGTKSFAKSFLYYFLTLTSTIYLLVINYHFGVLGKGSLAEKQTN